MNIKFSVLMSVYSGDRPEFIIQAIESILLQTLPPSEVVIIVDGPVNESISIALDDMSSKYSAIKIFSLVRNQGLAHALNYGLGKCSNEIVARMDADDISLPFRFERTVPFLIHNNGLSLVGAQHLVFSADMSVPEGIRNVPTDFNKIMGYSKLRTPINHPTIVFKKSHVERVSGYPEDVGRFEDWGLSLALLKNGFTIENIEDIVLHVRGGAEMMHRRRGLRYLIEEIKALTALYNKGLLTITDFIINLAFRVPLRTLPAGALKLLYVRLLRRGSIVS